MLIAAVALAATAISSKAQVYSQNIVGYVNVPANSGYVNLNNPLDESGGNSLTNIISNPNTGNGGPWDYTLVNVWNGTAYTTYTIDSSFPTGVADPSDSYAVTAPTINPGQAFFFQNTSGSNTLTIVGTVHVDGPATGTNVVGFTTNTIGTHPSETFIASKLPIGGGLGSVLGFTLANGVSDYNVVAVPNISAAGRLTGFTSYTVDSSFPTGFADPSDSFGVAEPQIPVGKGFFFFNTSGATINWTQSL